ncbi:MAG: septal ring lytic transglycosylase RlpA family protein [Alphaproteobacteria bacterium]|nr:septal ring lytic transglycosylase RlpA family protein [Alphaproteobacteria bacterium]
MLNSKIAMAASLIFTLTACAETQLALHTAKKLTGSQPAQSKGAYKVGKPYKIKGTWYYPAVNYGYVEKGVASWYGPQFHGRKTANGEIFDMNVVSAAHRTLPMPSVVRVTNLKNGRSLRIRVNDRGPFAKSRIIDLSRRAAQLLGYERSGTALVRVEIIADESRRMAAVAQGKAKILPSQTPAKVEIASLPGSVSDSGANVRVAEPPVTTPRVASPNIPKNTVKLSPVTGGKKIYVQAGSFVYRDLAAKMQKLLNPLGPTRIVEAVIGKRRYFRVQVGPASNVSQGDELLNLVIASGYPKARLVVD